MTGSIVSSGQADGGMKSSAGAEEAAEEARRARSRLKTLLVGISTRLINLPTARIDGAIEEMLAELGTSIGADSLFIFLLTADRSRLELSYEWLTTELGDSQERPAFLSAGKLPELLRRMARIEPFHIPSPGSLPAAASAEREELERFGIRSLLVAPISSRGEAKGLVGLASLRSERTWPEEAISVLRVIGEIVGGALDRKQSEEALAEAHRRLEVANRELEESNLKLALRNELGDLLQSCQSADEAIRVVASLLPQLFPAEAGGVYLLERKLGSLEARSSWGESPPAERRFEPVDCWALRRSRPHASGSASAGPRCRHVHPDETRPTLCIPLLAQGEALGLLHLRGKAADLGSGGDRNLQLAQGCAEHLALGLSNLRLRESLRSQALRDPLTGLFNRRYLEEQLGRELRRAERQGTSLGLLMLDLDHFKSVNDDHGHEVGDRVLGEVGRILLEAVRSEDVAARYGGEEFIVLLPDSGLEEAAWVAEKLRRAARSIRVRSGERTIAAPTLSVGVAAYPACGSCSEELHKAADRALYQAKRDGRDRVVVAQVCSPGALEVRMIRSLA